MTKNLIPEAVKMLGLEIGEEFNFCGYRKNNMIADDGHILEATDSGEWKRSDFTTLADLLRIPHQIRKLPWKPKKGEQYWVATYYNPCGPDRVLVITHSLWECMLNEEAFYKAGWIFKTQAEAEAALPAIAKELGVEYKIEGAL